MVPMSFRLRTDDGSQNAGNNWGAVLCPLGTDVADPMTRLRSISRSMSPNKALMSERYLNGCRLTDAYSVSVVSTGQALNITLVSDAHQTALGLTGQCGRHEERGGEASSMNQTHDNRTG